MPKTGITVYATTMGKKILFKNTNVASGLQVQQVGIMWTLTAREEAILSAGAFQSPQFLMVSGILPSTTLKSLGIKVISDLESVSQNMWDHVMFGSVYRVNVATSPHLTNDVAWAAESLVNYASGTGPLTAGGFGAVRANLTSATQTGLEAFPSD